MAVLEKRQRMKNRVIRALELSLDLDETETHWLVYISPSRNLAALGIAPHRARLPKCTGVQQVRTPMGGGQMRIEEIPHYQEAIAAKGGRCRCGSWNTYGVAVYLRRMLASYPKIRTVVQVPA